MPSKKKKYNARFPAGRIKKIMQTDEEVGKVAQAVPIIISRALELFVGSLLTKAMQITSAKNAKTLSPSHMKQCILSEQRFDFLKDLVKTVQDTGSWDEEPGTPSLVPQGLNKLVPERRKSSSSCVKEEFITKDESVTTLKEKAVVKEETITQPQVVANCSTLHFTPNFYSEIKSEPEESVHQPPLISTQTLSFQTVVKKEQSSMLVMDEDYDT